MVAWNHSKLFSYRFLIAILLAGAYFCVELVQSCIGIAIICMVDSNFFDQTKNETNRPKCPGIIANASRPDYGGTLKWPSWYQSLIFSAFQFGAILAPLTGWLGDKVSGKWLLITSVVLTSVAGASIPVLSYYSYLYVVGARILMGIGNSILIPAVNCLITKWFPLKERNLAIGISAGGRQIGTLIMLPLAGFFCSRKDILGGWPAMYYLAAIFGAAWTFLWIIFGEDDPFSRKYCISKFEVQYLKKQLAFVEDGDKSKKSKTPWMKLLKSSSVWAVGIAFICQDYAEMTVGLFLPSYLRDVYFVNSEFNGIASALPPLCFWISKLAAALIANFVQKRFNLRKTTVSKICNSIGCLGITIFFASLGFLSCNQAVIAIVLVCLGVICAGFHTPGCVGALVAVAPQYSGLITGVTYFFISIIGIVHPIVTKAITVDGLKWQWDIVFYINAAISFIPLIVFNIWGKAEEESWAKDNEEKIVIERF